MLGMTRKGPGDRFQEKGVVGYDGFASMLIRARTNYVAIFTTSGLIVSTLYNDWWKWGWTPALTTVMVGTSIS